jgi:hypothetical protein
MPEAFRDRVLAAIDEGFLDQVKMCVLGIFNRTISGEPMTISVKKFAVAFNELLDAREQALKEVKKNDG